MHIKFQNTKSFKKQLLLQDQDMYLEKFVHLLIYFKVLKKSYSHLFA